MVEERERWIERILSDTQSHNSFLAYIDTRETDLLQEMRHAVKEDNMDSARVFAGESLAWEKLRNQLLMYQREEEQNGIIQEGRPTG